MSSSPAARMDARCSSVGVEINKWFIPTEEDRPIRSNKFLSFAIELFGRIVKFGPDGMAGSKASVLCL